ncbi:type VI secretion system baseplate subunit TssG [Aquabacterium sp.]|uniref:type VI secretion system baseplate subunit TssG n=1 Tax=Aquabacterium sp. TaxID=1872578 RepID=UPI002CB4726B|nr:type VI secretion system baseplate subunit TssG [Aquabacterium sp.]HSW04165.1 type VI secretion system baseplate subunit TssG [Aquabacterium sp.]
MTRNPPPLAPAIALRVPAPNSAIAHLLAEPHRYGFMQAVRLLERWHVQQQGLSAQEVLGQRLRFRNSLSLCFPPSEIAEFKAVAAPPVRPGEAAHFERYEITPAFMGLLGAGGTLPTFYTELFARREQLNKDSSSRRFLDIFVHRAVVLFYQAWRKHRLPLRFEADRRNEYLPRVLALAGLGQKSLRERLRAAQGGVADDTLAHYAGLLQQRPISAAAIRQILSHYFDVPVRLEQFVGRWFTLPRRQQSMLGLGQVTLGSQAVVGERVWQRDLRLRLTFGPMGREQFVRFLPPADGATGHTPGAVPQGQALVALRELLTLLTGLSLEYEVRLCLRAADVQPATLDAQQGPRLGWDGFLITRPAAGDRSDAGYDIHALA